MFALEPEFDQRERVRDYFKHARGSLDERLLRMPEWSHANCWYRAEPHTIDKLWLQLDADASAADPGPELEWPAGDPFIPPQQLGAYGFQLDAPFLETPYEVVSAMLDLAELGPSDVLLDAGCGDGRIVIAAARSGVRAHGIDLDPLRLSEARNHARPSRPEHLASFERRDVLDLDLTGVTVVTLYLLRDLNLSLRTRLRERLPPGARIISRSFDMGDWIPDAMITVQNSRLFRWTISA